MRKLFIGIVLALSAVLASGCCTAERRLAEDIEKIHGRLFPMLTNYIDKDPALKPEDKEDKKGLMRAAKDAVDALKKALD